MGTIYTALHLRSVCMCDAQRIRRDGTHTALVNSTAMSLGLSCTYSRKSKRGEKNETVYDEWMRKDMVIAVAEDKEKEQLSFEFSVCVVGN